MKSKQQLTPDFIAKASENGLRFEQFLTPDLASWILQQVEEGVYVSPSEAVFHMLQHHRDFVQHSDLVTEVLFRTLQEASDSIDRGEGISGEELEARLEELEEIFKRKRQKPVYWKNDPHVYDDLLGEVPKPSIFQRIKKWISIR